MNDQIENNEFVSNFNKQRAADRESWNTYIQHQPPVQSSTFEGSKEVATFHCECLVPRENIQESVIIE